MKNSKTLLTILGFYMGILSIFSLKAQAGEPQSIYSLQVKTITGKDAELGEYRGKVSLVVNTASKCGFTGQYEDLEALYQKYKDQGFVVLGFPSNDFGAQEPGSNEDIASFCKLNYGVSFPLFAKGAVKGESKQPVYKRLTEESGADFAGDPGWNFVKFLVDKNGFVRERYSSMTKPLSGKITKRIEELLTESK